MFMVDHVKTDGRAHRAAATQARILAAARELFVRDGYARTTLTAVADQAGVGHRTVYVHFGSKAALLMRVIGVALAGDTEPGDVHEREWYQRALTAPTARERIAALSHGSSAMASRAAPVIAVALEAAAIEQEIAQAAQQGRLATRRSLRRFWAAMREDGLIADYIDLGWLADTSSLLAHAETYINAKSMLGISDRGHRAWLETTLTALAGLDGETPP